jgi:transposase InsO family protein
LIDAQKATFPIARMAELLRVSRSGYYAWAQRRAAGPGMREVRRLELVGKIEAAHEASDGVNGAPRITADLRDAGEVISVKTTAKLMRRSGIRGISPRPWRPVTTIVDPNPHVIPDLVGRRFDQGVLNTVWTSDITYLATGQGWLYLCAVRDGCSRRVLGYAFSGSLHTDVVEDALRRAVAFRAPGTGTTAGVIFHADRGCQYTSAQLARFADRHNLARSVGRTGVCWDKGLAS